MNCPGFLARCDVARLMSEGNEGLIKQGATKWEEGKERGGGGGGIRPSIYQPTRRIAVPLCRASLISCSSVAQANATFCPACVASSFPNGNSSSCTRPAAPSRTSRLRNASSVVPNRAVRPPWTHRVAASPCDITSPLRSTSVLYVLRRHHVASQKYL